LLIAAFLLYFICRSYLRNHSVNWGARKLFDYEFRNVLDVSYGAYVVNGAYSGSSNPTGAPNHNDAVAIIRELLCGNTADVRLQARDASTAVSIVQTFTKAIDTIAGKLAKMQELAKKAPSGDHSQVQVEQMQTQFQNLAKEINQTVNSTEYNFNKSFAGSGKTLSIPIGNGSKIDIFARDFRFDAQGLNIATDPQNALSTVNEAITNLAQFSGKPHLRQNPETAQRQRLSRLSEVVESRAEN